MSTHAKLLAVLLNGGSDRNIAFRDLRSLLVRLGFSECIRGAHLYTRRGIEEILNLQAKGPLPKPHQVKQVRAVMLKYRSGLDHDP